MRLLLVNLLLSLFLSACTKKSDYKIETNNIEVSQLIKIDSSIVKFYLPFKKTLEESLMNTPISYSFETYKKNDGELNSTCLLYTSPSPRDRSISRMPSSA